MGDWRSALRRLLASGSGLGDETEDFLAGRFLERARANGGARRLEPWMWLNTLAHGSYESLRAIASGGACSRDDGPWHDMQVVVAREMHRRCGYDLRVLTYLQRAVLVPLELRLLEDRDLAPDEVTDIALRNLAAADR